MEALLQNRILIAAGILLLNLFTGLSPVILVVSAGIAGIVLKYFAGRRAK